MGQQRNSTRFPNTSAVLVYVSEMNGRLQLTSHLTVTVSESATDQIHSVTCSHMMNSSTISFQIIAGKSNSKSEHCHGMFAGFHLEVGGGVFPPLPQKEKEKEREKEREREMGKRWGEGL